MTRDTTGSPQKVSDRAEGDTEQGGVLMPEYALPTLPESAVPPELVERAAVAIKAEWDSINEDTRTQAGESFKRRVYAEAAFKVLFESSDLMERLAVEHYPTPTLDLYDCDACGVTQDVCVFHRGINAVCAVIDADPEGHEVLTRLVPEA